jgi:SAM-dependent methyltransferase
MSDAQQAAAQGAPDPSLIFETLNAHQRSAALRGAIELELFTAIAEGNRTAAAIAGRCQASERGIRVLCDFLTVHGFVTKQDGEYGLPPVSAAFLDKKSPAYMGSIAQFVNSPDLLRAFGDVAETVRRGRTMLDGHGSVEPDWDGWVTFAKSMAPMMGPASDFIGKLAAEGANGSLRTLDIAAGHGLFGIGVARHNPTAEIVALDWPRVLEVARGNAQAAGVHERYSLLPGSAFEVEYGNNFDLILATNFFHHFNARTCESLMRKMHAALNHGGRVITLEFVPGEDRVSPPIPASFSMMMLGTTADGDAYTFAEYDRMFRNAGFSRNEIHQPEKSPQQVIVSQR